MDGKITNNVAHLRDLSLDTKLNTRSSSAFGRFVELADKTDREITVNKNNHEIGAVNTPKTLLERFMNMLGLMNHTTPQENKEIRDAFADAAGKEIDTIVNVSNLKKGVDAGRLKAELKKQILAGGEKPLTPNEITEINGLIMANMKYPQAMRFS